METLGILAITYLIVSFINVFYMGWFEVRAYYGDSYPEMFVLCFFPLFNIWTFILYTLTFVLFFASKKRYQEYMSNGGFKYEQD